MPRSRRNASQAVAGTCGICGRPLTQVGLKGECLRCLADLGFLSGSQEPEESETPRRLTPGPLKYDHFEVEVGADGFPIELGAGAMAITYRARDTVLNSVVALKVIDRSVAKDPRRARVSCGKRAQPRKSIIRMSRVSVITVNKTVSVSMSWSWSKAKRSRRRVRREGPMPLALALEVIEQAARALAAAEACGVVHRDIKPSNIMLESDPAGAFIVKVIDYGIAKVLAPEAERGAEKPNLASLERLPSPARSSSPLRSRRKSTRVRISIRLA